jgi:glutamate N-acetyltransferase/amino-acid N-acetyltransferase
VSVTAPKGWLASGVRGGTKPSGDLDLALVWSEVPAVVAGTFTTSSVPSAHVIVCKPRVATGIARGVVVSAGIANAFTGADGVADAERMASVAAEATGSVASEMLVCATGTIGPRIPVDDVAPAIAEAATTLSVDGGQAAARAIMTTDTHPKTATRTVLVDGHEVTVGGMAKGAGMIAPRMELQGTLLVFITTDAVVSSSDLRDVVGAAVDKTFNAITIDGCMSTSDTVLMFANGASGVDATGNAEFARAVEEVMAELAYAVVADGEGATRVIRVQITGAASAGDAREIAREVAESMLLKSAVWGNDPNMGRIVQAAGQANAALDPDKLVVSMCGVELSVGGTETGRRAEASELMKAGGDVIVGLEVGLGSASFEFLTCDLTPDYVRFNGDYTT